MTNQLAKTGDAIDSRVALSILPDDRFWVALSLAKKRDTIRLFETLDTQQFGIGSQFRSDAANRFYQHEITSIKKSNLI